MTEQPSTGKTRAEARLKAKLDAQVILPEGLQSRQRRRALERMPRYEWKNGTRRIAK